MIKNKTLTVIMPAYNAEKTLEKTYSEIPMDIVDNVVLVDDSSNDKTKELAKKLGINTYYHIENKGYGANQKSCYKIAIDLKSDIVIMLHPDYQYSPKLIRAMASLIADDVYEVVMGSRILGKGTLAGGMPIYKYISNRILTLIQNILINQKLSEYHSGYRAFSANALKSIPIDQNSDDFIFDNQMLVQLHYKKFAIAEITCPTKYFDEASSINFIRSLKYGFLCIWTSFIYLMHSLGLINSRLFKSNVDWYKEKVPLYLVKNYFQN
jgi:glycosyltransferase involved in cell wall biosynthesis